METTEQNKQKSTTAYKITIALLLGVIGFLIWQVYTVKQQVTVVIQEKEATLSAKTSLQLELDSLMLQYDSIKEQYGTLNKKLTKQDSIIAKYAYQIKQLLASQTDARRVKRHLDFLRGHMKEYVTQLDSLYTVSRELKQENIKVKDDLKKEQDKTTALTSQTKELTSKVDLASQLHAYKITTTLVRIKGDKEQLTDKGVRADKIKVAFTLGKNDIIQAGDKDIYLRIAAPNESILMKSESDEFSFVTKDGGRLQYSSKKTIKYEKKPMDVAVYWDRNNDFLPGTYYATLYADGVQIGETSFVVK